MKFSNMAVAGFAMFSMVFGAGNIVFPLILGRDFTTSSWYAIMGWGLTAVIIPVLGYFCALLFFGDVKRFWKPLERVPVIGKHLPIICMSVLMCICGPFGTLARSVTIAFESVYVSMPIDKVVFNLIFCLVAAILAWNPGKVVQLIGVIFTPLKFGGVVIVAACAMYFGGSFSDMPQCTAGVGDVMMHGAAMGYQTMDLIAGVMFGASIFAYIKKAVGEGASTIDLLKFSTIACIICGLTFLTTYIFLVFCGAMYSNELVGCASAGLFPEIARISMGQFASCCVSIIIAACCLATNIATSSAFTDFIYKEICKEKVNRQVLLVATCAITFGCSLLGFEAICNILGAVLKVVYPLLIVFVLYRTVQYFACKMYNEN